MSRGVLIVAAGKGTRMRSIEKKQFLSLLGKPVLAWTVSIFEEMEEIDDIVIVSAVEDVGRIEVLREQYDWQKVRKIVSGGLERQQSVLNGLHHLSTEWVLVHDGVRPMVSKRAVQRCIMVAEEHGGAILAVPVKDTIKVVTSEGRIDSTPNRASLWAAHTPQVFRREALLKASLHAADQDWLVTDDASVMEKAGYPVVVVQDDEKNIKITTPEDLEMVEKWLVIRQEESK